MMNMKKSPLQYNDIFPEYVISTIWSKPVFDKETALFLGYQKWQMTKLSIAIMIGSILTPPILFLIILSFII